MEDIYEIEKILGPYQRKSNKRLYLKVKCKNGKELGISYPKFKMEFYLGRKLKDHETVDHIDCDVENNHINNLRVINNIQHAIEDIKRTKSVKIKCVWCKNICYKNVNNLRGNAKKGQAGPFCGRKCSGEYGSAVRKGKINKIEAPNYNQWNTENREYFKLKDLIDVKPTISLNDKEIITKENELLAFIEKYQRSVGISRQKTFIKHCYICNKQLTKWQKKYCSYECSNIGQRKVSRPSKEELQRDINNMSWVAIGKKYGISNSAVKKWARGYGII